MEYEEVQILTQLVSAMDEAVKKMEDYYDKRDLANFENAKKSVLSFQKQIAQLLARAR
ncbi:MAG: hypothetical protein KKB21_04800 [Nanoarchaeota archaeon]|nr:hypothetical protein [Nanoarchaeota archaeon]